MLDPAALDALFRSARTHYRWQDRPVPDGKLMELYDLLRLGPTSANCSPARFVFLRTTEAKARLKPCLSPGNIEKTMTAPVVCIVATDPWFYDRMPQLMPGTDARSWFANNASFAEETARRNGTLQGAYLILAARAVGLDAGPMSGFDNLRVDAEFLAERGWRSDFLVNLGYGDPAGLPPRLPRLDFDEACVLL
jgi:3-hydroxypropanoate dehydrogenase